MKKNWLRRSSCVLLSLAVFISCCFVIASADSVTGAPVASDKTEENLIDNSFIGTFPVTDENYDTLIYSIIQSPTHGSVVVNNDGTYTYDSSAGYQGQDSFTFKANDGVNDSNTATITIFNVKVSSNELGGLTEEESFITDADPGPNYGKTQFKDFFGMFNGWSQCKDGSGNMLNVSVDNTVQHDGVTSLKFDNQSEFSVDGNKTVAGNTQMLTCFTVVPGRKYKVSMWVKNDLLSDENWGFDSLFTLYSSEALEKTFYDDISAYAINNYTAVSLLTDDGVNHVNNSEWTEISKTFIAPEGASFGYLKLELWNENGIAWVSDLSSVSIANLAPVASDKTEENLIGETFTGMLPVTDEDHDLMTYSVVDNPSHGSVTVNADGTYTYVPSSVYDGEDSFTFKANDGVNDSNTATITISNVKVSSNELGGLTEEESFITDADPGPNYGKTQFKDFFGIFNGWSQAKDDTGKMWNVSIDTAVKQNGYSSLKFDNESVFTIGGKEVVPFNTFLRTCFTVVPGRKYKVSMWVKNDLLSDEHWGFDSTFTLYKADALKKTIYDDVSSYAISGYTGVPLLTDADIKFVNNNDSDDWTQISKVFVAPQGASFGYLNIELWNEFGTAWVSDLSVVAISNQAPVAQDGSIFTNVNQTYNAFLTASDPDGDELTYSLVQDAEHGTATVNSSGKIVYVPDTDYQGTDCFTYKANDGKSDSNTVTMTIYVNTAPVAKTDLVKTPVNTQINGTVSATDQDGDSLTYSLVSDAENGTVMMNADGSYTYTPKTGYNGADSFTYKASDGVGDSTIVTVTIHVGLMDITTTAPTEKIDDANITDDVSKNVNTSDSLPIAAGFAAVVGMMLLIVSVKKKSRI